MKVLALDPGPTHTAWVVFEGGKLHAMGYEENDTALLVVGAGLRGAHLAVEMIASYGMPVGAEVFETCVWIGRFIQAWGGEHTKVYRKDVKLHLCGNTRAKDPNIRAALLDRFGPGRERAMGTKKKPGPLYGVSGDVWAALAVAVTWADLNQEASR